jgi:hypothetical protein
MWMTNNMTKVMNVAKGKSASSDNEKSMIGRMRLVSECAVQAPHDI